MAVEIERKFLVTGHGWQGAILRSSELRQAYLSSRETTSVRVRVRDGVRATLTIKSALRGTARDEFEYAIPVDDAEQLFALRDGALIEKTRYEVRAGLDLWEVDVFVGDNAGLVLAEIELEEAGTTFHRPDWLGGEVTDDKRYYNNVLATHPYKDWRDGDRPGTGGSVKHGPDGEVPDKAGKGADLPSNI